MLRTVGSIAFVLGLFVAVFFGIPWYVYHEPTLPVWLKIAVYLLLAGVLVVLLSLATQRRDRMPDGTEREGGLGSDLLLLNSSDIPGREIDQVLGLVHGHTIYAIWLGKDLSALIRLILGGELIEYTELMGYARRVAIDRMIAQAQDLAADAIINVRFVTTSVVGSAAELLAYGTAVKLKTPPS